MPRSLWIAMLCVIVCLAGLGIAAAAEPANSGQEVFDRIEADYAAGNLTIDQAILYKFYYGFDKSQLPGEYRLDTFSPMKNGTAVVAEYQRLKDQLSPRTVEIIEAYLERPRGDGTRDSYISPSGFFLLTYSTTGADAVPATDVNPANGIPDYIEKVAGYCDYSKDLECDQMTFSTPPHSPYYYIYFESMEYYGYTSGVGYNGSQITLHNNFLGFPPNDDPEGNQWGAAKVTVAHEFKHATQRAGSRWTEGGWVEVDATWMEDIAYDYVNDYYNYLPYGSPISSPTQSLDYGGTGSYEDCVWQHWMSETWGNQIIIDLWAWRRTHTAQAMLNSYNAMLVSYGSSLTAGWPIFTAWNYATGTKAIAGFGYGEAADYPTSPNFALISTYPTTRSSTVNYLAAKFVRCRLFSTNPGTVDIIFDGQDATLIALTAVIEKTDGTAVLEAIALDGSCNATTSLSVPREQISEVGFSVSNATTSGSAISFSLTVGQSDAVAQPAITLSDESFYREVAQDSTSVDMLGIFNTGDAGSTLHFDVTVQDTAPKALPGGDEGAPVSTEGSGSLSALSRVDWLTVDPLTGDVPQGSNIPLDLEYNTAGMALGSYQAYVVITHNAPGSPEVVPVNLTVVRAWQAVETGEPPVFRIAGTYPNPFGPLTTIALSIPVDGAVTVDVVDVNGRLVRTLWQGALGAGAHSFPWDGRDDAGRTVSAGTYFARMHTAEGMSATKMILAD
jgi:hypothetical protein